MNEDTNMYYITFWKNICLFVFLPCSFCMSALLDVLMHAFTFADFLFHFLVLHTKSMITCPAKSAAAVPPFQYSCVTFRSHPTATIQKIRRLRPKRNPVVRTRLLYLATVQIWAWVLKKGSVFMKIHFALSKCVAFFHGDVNRNGALL